MAWYIDEWLCIGMICYDLVGLVTSVDLMIQLVKYLSKIDFKIIESGLSLKDSEKWSTRVEDNSLQKGGCSSLWVGAGKWENVVSFCR